MHGGRSLYMNFIARGMRVTGLAAKKSGNSNHTRANPSSKGVAHGAGNKTPRSPSCDDQTCSRMGTLRSWYVFPLSSRSTENSPCHKQSRATDGRGAAKGISLSSNDGFSQLE